jgi:ABC-type nitrate/sulfonate/bicarbonate transport system permease component
MILIGLIGLAMNEALLLLEKYLFRWRWEVKL